MKSFTTTFLFVIGLLAFGLIAGAQSIPAKPSQAFQQQLREAKTDSAHIQALLQYGSFLIDYDKDSANAVLTRAIAASEKGKYTYGLGKGHLLLGVSHAENGKLAIAKSHYEKALTYFLPLQNHLEIGKTYNNMGNLHNMQGMIQDAVNDYMKAISSFQQVKDGPPIDVLYSNIAVGLTTIKEFEKAIYYCKKGEEEALKRGDTLTYIKLLIAHGSVYLKSEREAAALPYLKKSLELSKQLNYVPGISVSLANTASYYFTTGRLDSAHHYMKLAEPWAEQTNDPYYTEAVYYGLGDIMLSYKKYDEALSYLQRAIKASTQIRNRDYLAKSYEKLSDVYAAKGLYAQGLEALQKSKLYNDSVRNEESTRQVNLMETRFRSAEKDKEIAEKQLQIARQEVQLQSSQKRTFFSISLAMVALLVAAFIYYRYRNKKRLHQRELETLQKEKELQTLQALMQGEEKERSRIAKDLHDGVGSLLSATKMYISTLGNEYKGIEYSAAYQEAMALLLEASSEVRKTAHNLAPDILNQYGLEEAIGNFCNKINKTHILQIEFQCYGIPQRFSSTFELMVYRVVQELIHNIVRHAQATQAIVQLSFDEHMLSITVEDNGKGFNMQRGASKNGIGIHSLQSRVKSYDGIMEIETSEGEGTTAYIEFYLEKIKERIYV